MSLPGRACRSIPAIAAVICASFLARSAAAHCDTMDGPVVTSARQALEDEDPSAVLVWVRPEYEAELNEAFDLALSVREEGGDAASLAETWFFETVVRLHRAGEGEPYEGLKPSGTAASPAVVAADMAVESGVMTDLETLLNESVSSGLRERFAHLMQLRASLDGGVEAGREYTEAYVEFVHYAEEVESAATMR